MGLAAGGGGVESLCGSMIGVADREPGKEVGKGAGEGVGIGWTSVAVVISIRRVILEDTRRDVMVTV